MKPIGRGTGDKLKAIAVTRARLARAPGLRGGRTLSVSAPFVALFRNM
ncbi:hypothetical protein [Rhodanobacter lindaniclasticus]